MANKEDQDVLRLLVQHVSRSFYEPKYTIVMDQLCKQAVLKDDDLATRMGLQSKELNKLMAVLTNDRIVKVYRQNELKEGAQRSVGKQYYYIDYQHFCNVVKWRVSQMRQKIDSTLRNDLNNKGFICPQCQKTFHSLDVQSLMDFARGAFFCDICSAELIDDENAESVRGSQDRMQRFNHQMRFVREGLQKSEAMILPAFDVELWIKNNLTEAEKQKAAAAGFGLKIAGSDPSAKVDDGIGIVMSLDKDESTRKAERDAEAAAKRVQNALPTWHLKSTISGELTALGIKENARAEAANRAGMSESSSNDDILKGLGVIGGSRPEVKVTPTVVEDKKPVINHEADYYDQYYASLAASTAATARNTPIGIDRSAGEEFGEDEDQKPSVEYLDSLNDYRKRSRSAEDIGGTAKTKMIKTEEANGMNGNFNGAAEHEDAIMGDGGVGGEDPLVQVNGNSKPLSQITDEDHELMTPEEYTTYFEILQAHS